MTTKTKHCSITYYNDRLVTEFHTLESIEGELVSPYDKPSNLGFVVLDVGHVGISKEAYDAMSRLKRGRDCIGDIDVFYTTDDVYCFAVMGGACGIFNINTAVTSRTYRQARLDQYQLIENEVPEGAKDAIDNPSDDEDDEE